MATKGLLIKMGYTNQGNEFQVKPLYHLKLGADFINMNVAINSKVSVAFTGRLECIECGRTTRKSFAQGYCYPCFTSVPQAEECVLRPELCKAHLGVARNMDYAREHCLTRQYVYLAHSGGLKVGVTRHHQVPTRWVDQGATTVIPVAITPNRYNAGLVEVALKKLFADKTNWRRMLKGEETNEDLAQCRAKALEALAGSGIDFEPSLSGIYTINYPYNGMPGKLASVNLDRVPTIEGVLHGIKGQYLIFSDGRVMNIRRHTGYEVEVSIG